MSKEKPTSRRKPEKPRGLRARLKAIAFRLLAIGFALGFLLLLLEIGLRVATSSGISLLEKNEIYGQTYLPGFEGEMYIAEAKRKVVLRFDRNGRRGPDRPHQKPAGVRRVALLGDSTIAAVAVDEVDTMAARMERSLNKDSSTRWEVLNFGVSGYGTGQSYLTLKHLALAYEPDIVVLAFTISNDLSDNSRELSTANRPYYSLDEQRTLVLHPMSSARTSLSNLLANSRIYNWQKDLFRRARYSVIRKIAPKLGGGLHILNQKPPESIQRAWGITRALLTEMQRECSAAKAKFLVVSVPYSSQYDERLWKMMISMVPEGERGQFDKKLPDRDLETFCGSLGIEFHALLPAFTAKRPEGLLNLMGGGGHWNVEGNHLAASETSSKIQELGWAD